MNRENNQHPLLTKESPWSNNENPIWLGSTLQIHRNYEKFNFPGKLPPEKRKQIISVINQGLMKSQQLKNPKMIPAETLSPQEKEFLVEHFLSNQGFHQASSGEAFILDETSEFLAVINLKDHIFLEFIDVKEELENSWERLVKLESEIAQSANFAFSQKFGFLTSDPGKCGTAFIVTIFLHLPALIFAAKLEDIIRKNKEDGALHTGLQGDPTEVIGDIAAFHNTYTIGVTEENILSSLRTLGTKLVVEEKGMRKFYKQASEVETAGLKDKVSRAYAILLHSYQIDAIEALQAISLLKLGLDLDWIKGTTHAVLNHLLFACRRAHLMCQHKDNISYELLPHKRSEFIHKVLQGLTLLI